MSGTSPGVSKGYIGGLKRDGIHQKGPPGKVPEQVWASAEHISFGTIHRSPMPAYLKTGVDSGK